MLRNIPRPFPPPVMFCSSGLPRRPYIRHRHTALATLTNPVTRPMNLTAHTDEWQKRKCRFHKRRTISQLAGYMALGIAKCIFSITRTSRARARVQSVSCDYGQASTLSSERAPTVPQTFVFSTHIKICS